MSGIAESATRAPWGRGRDPLLRMFALGRPRAGRFALGVLAGAAATASGVGLLSVSAWLIAMAATQPPLTLLSIAIVATRALGVLRGVTRYLERLITHDAALRTLADARARVYARLAHTEPVRRFRSGDLVTRLVSDTDATQDLLVRGLTPPAAALVTGAGVVALSTALLVPGGALLAAGLLLAGVGVPVAAALAGRGPGRRATAARAELSTALIDTVHGVPDLLAYGAMDRATARVTDADAELTRIARRDAAQLGLGAGAFALIAGLTLWGTLLLGVAAVHGGALGRRPAGRAGADRAGGVRDRRPAAGGRRPARRRAGVGCPAVRGAGHPARGPGARGRCRRKRSERGFGCISLNRTPLSLHRARPTAPRVSAFATCACATARTSRGRSTGSTSTCTPAGASPSSGPAGPARARWPRCCSGSATPTAGPCTSTGSTSPGATPTTPAACCPGCRRTRTCSRRACATTCCWPGRAATDDQLWDVLRRVRLADDVTVLPDGLGTEVGPQGARLSGGMRGRLALARALLADPEVLVLDEPTTHLDPDTRDAVLDDILAATTGRTVLLVTHDLSHLDRFDEVAVVVGGRVVQRGAHADLIATDGWYRAAHDHGLPEGVTGR